MKKAPEPEPCRERKLSGDYHICTTNEMRHLFIQPSYREELENKVCARDYVVDSSFLDDLGI